MNTRAAITHRTTGTSQAGIAGQVPVPGEAGYGRARTSPNAGVTGYTLGGGSVGMVTALEMTLHPAANGTQARCSSRSQDETVMITCMNEPVSIESVPKQKSNA